MSLLLFIPGQEQEKTVQGMENVFRLPTSQEWTPMTAKSNDCQNDSHYKITESEADD